ncbi:hypothetical protein RIVM261_012410 [Rivularia sp. IAM M-261]|nr:hypothetical protein CAL7716_071440 [Calothrix sp. PCC 7716]GJD16285.1 hypothetical protein RIVM261_012410 [Rivularia sp. IAM M-261]
MHSKSIYSISSGRFITFIYKSHFGERGQEKKAYTKFIDINIIKMVPRAKKQATIRFGTIYNLSINLTTQDEHLRSIHART